MIIIIKFKFFDNFNKNNHSTKKKAKIVKFKWRKIIRNILFI